MQRRRSQDGKSSGYCVELPLQRVQKLVEFVECIPQVTMKEPLEDLQRRRLHSIMPESIPPRYDSHGELTFTDIQVKHRCSNLIYVSPRAGGLHYMKKTLRAQRAFIVKYLESY